MWLAIAREAGAPAVTHICVVSLEQGEFIPAGFTPVRRHATMRPAPLRCGAPTAGGGSNAAAAAAASVELYLCYSKASGAPIVDLSLVFPYGATGAAALKRLFRASESSTAGGGEPPLPLGVPAPRFSALPDRWRPSTRAIAAVASRSTWRSRCSPRGARDGRTRRSGTRPCRSRCCARQPH